MGDADGCKRATNNSVAGTQLRVPAIPSARSKRFLAIWRVTAQRVIHRVGGRGLVRYEALLLMIPPMSWLCHEAVAAAVRGTRWTTQNSSRKWSQFSSPT